MAGLFEHIGDVEADRPLRDAEQLGNLLARLAAADELQDLELALRQVGFRRTERIPAADDGKDVLAAIVRRMQSMNASPAASL